MEQKRFQELRTIYLNMNRAHENRDWESVDRAVQRMAEFIVTEGTE